MHASGNFPRRSFLASSTMVVAGALTLTACTDHEPSPTPYEGPPAPRLVADSLTEAHDVTKPGSVFRAGDAILVQTAPVAGSGAAAFQAFDRYGSHLTDGAALPTPFTTEAGATSYREGQYALLTVAGTPTIFLPTQEHCSNATCNPTFLGIQAISMHDHRQRWHAELASWDVGSAADPLTCRIIGSADNAGRPLLVVQIERPGTTTTPRRPTAVLVLDAASGDRLWVTELNSDAALTPYAVVTRAGPTTTALDISTGQEIWRTDRQFYASFPDYLILVDQYPQPQSWRVQRHSDGVTSDVDGRVFLSSVAGSELMWSLMGFLGEPRTRLISRNFGSSQLRLSADVPFRSSTDIVAERDYLWLKSGAIWTAYDRGGTACSEPLSGDILVPLGDGILYLASKSGFQLWQTTPS